MVAGPAAQLFEVLQPLGQGGAHVLHAVQAGLAHAGGQLAHVLGEAGLVDVDRLVGAEGGAHLHLDGGIGGDLLVPLQGVDGIVGGADHGHVGLLDDAPDGEIGVVAQLLVAEVPALLGGLRGEGLVVAEELPQLQVAPVVHGVADGHLQRLGELHEALKGGLGTGHILLGHPVGAHDPPLVVIAEVGAVGVLAPQPQLDQIVEPAVLIDLLGGDVAVVVHQRHGLRVVVEQVLGGVGAQQEILIHKLFHTAFPPNQKMQEAARPVRDGRPPA